MKIVNEKEILENLNHKNIINFVDYHSDEENGVYVIVTEYFPSITLKTFLEGWISDYSQRINLFRKLYDCISYLHRQKVLHRDLNVENILISTENLEFKIIDFGVALNLKNQDFILNDEGNIKYRMKETYFTSDDPLGIDCWGLQLIFLSLFFQKVYSSKEAYEMFKMNNVPQIIEDKFNINLALKVFSEKRDSRQFLNGLFIVLDLQ